MALLFALSFSLVAGASAAQLRRPSALNATSAVEAKGLGASGILSNTLATLDTQVGALEQHLADMQSQGEAELQRLSENQSAWLQKRRHEIGDLEALNRKLYADVQLAEKRVRKLRREAASMQHANGELLALIGVLRQNVSTAKEIARDTVGRATEMREPVAKELAELAANISNMTAITPKSLAMLVQTGGVEDKAADAAQQLSATLDTVVADHDATVASITKAFERKFAALGARRDASLQKQAEIQAKLNEASAVEAKLAAAVDHLRNINARLQATRDQLRYELATLGAAPGA